MYNFRKGGNDDGCVVIKLYSPSIKSVLYINYYAALHELFYNTNALSEQKNTAGS
jgi:hypothetical protein